MKSTQADLKAKSLDIRKFVLQKAYQTQKGHIGATFSCVDLLVALHYGGILNLTPQDPNNKNRDRFVMGKGHACVALYYILSDMGFIHRSLLDNLGENGSFLGGQLNINTPGVDYSTGSLGNAVGICAGMVLSGMQDNLNFKAYAIIGDGELSEGSIWESFKFAADYKIKDLVCIVDRNRLSVTRFTDENESDHEMAQKVAQFGWETCIVNGHSFDEIFDAFKEFKNSTKPVFIVANTIKGKGISFMENGVKWHHSIPNENEFLMAMKELGDEL